jgi:hypothetical protein
MARNSLHSANAEQHADGVSLAPSSCTSPFSIIDHISRHGAAHYQSTTTPTPRGEDDRERSRSLELARHCPVPAAICPSNLVRGGDHEGQAEDVLGAAAGAALPRHAPPGRGRKGRWRLQRQWREWSPLRPSHHRRCRRPLNHTYSAAELRGRGLNWRVSGAAATFTAAALALMDDRTPASLDRLDTARVVAVSSGLGMQMLTSGS